MKQNGEIKKNPGTSGKTWKWSEEQKQKHSDRMKEIANRLEIRELLSQNAKRAWSRPEVRKLHIKKTKEAWSKPGAKEHHGNKMRELWKNPEARKIHVEARKKYWANISYEEKLVRTLPARMAVPFVSKGEMALYESIKSFYPEAEIAQWIVYYQADIVLQEHKINIEYDGVYWHGDKRQKDRDKARDEFLQTLGWAILRVPEGEKFDIDILHKLVNERQNDARLSSTAC